MKARNATIAGASAVIIYNNAANAAGAPPGMADDGINGPFVTVPSVSFNRPDGLAVIGAVGPVVANIGVDLTIRAGADSLGRARLYAVFPFASGSSVSHYDTVARRNLLMEPAINPDLTHNVKAPDDLTLELFRDIGWFADADLDGVADQTDCNPQSDLTATIVVGGINTNVPNTLFSSGCTISDLIAQIRATTNSQGPFVSGVAALLNSLVSSGLITQAQMDVVMAAVAEAKKRIRKARVVSLRTSTTETRGTQRPHRDQWVERDDPLRRLCVLSALCGWRTSSELRNPPPDLPHVLVVRRAELST